MKKILITAVLTLASIGAHAQVTYKTSFDCAKASSDAEHLICNDPELARDDEQLARVFAQAKAIAPDQAAFKQRTREAWNYREHNCHDRDCLIRWYADQEETLSEITDKSATKAAPTGSQPKAASDDSSDGVIVAHQISPKTGNRIEFSYVPCSKLPDDVPSNVSRDPSGLVVFSKDKTGREVNIGCAGIMQDKTGSVTVVGWTFDNEESYFLSTDMQPGK
jgi:uncharacterized protein